MGKRLPPRRRAEPNPFYGALDCCFPRWRRMGKEGQGGGRRLRCVAVGERTGKLGRALFTVAVERRYRGLPSAGAADPRQPATCFVCRPLIRQKRASAKTAWPRCCRAGPSRRVFEFEGFHAGDTFLRRPRRGPPSGPDCPGRLLGPTPTAARGVAGARPADPARGFNSKHWKNNLPGGGRASPWKAVGVLAPCGSRDGRRTRRAWTQGLNCAFEAKTAEGPRPASALKLPRKTDRRFRPPGGFPPKAVPPAADLSITGLDLGGRAGARRRHVHVHGRGARRLHFKIA